MPQIPVYQQQVSARGSAGPDAPRIHTELIADIGRDFQQGFDEKRQRETDSTITRAMADLRLTTEKRYLEAQQNAADDAAGFAKGIDESFSADRTAIATKIADREARNRFIETSDRLIRSDLTLRATQFETGQAVTSRAIRADQDLNKRLAAVELNPDTWAMQGVEHSVEISALGLPPAERLKVTVEANRALNVAAAKGWARKDPKRFLDRLATNNEDDFFHGFLRPEERHGLEQFAKGQLVESEAARIVGEYGRSTTAGTAALVGLGKSDIPRELLDNVRASVGAQLSQLRAERRQVYVDDIARVDREIATGNVGPGTEQRIEQLYESGVYGAEEYANQLAAMDRSAIATARDNAGGLEIATALAAGLPLDPSSEKQREALASLFAHQVGEQPIGSEPWRATALAIANQTRMLPKQAIAWTRAAMRSPNPELAATAAQFLGAVEIGAPDAISGFDADTRAFASTVDSMIAAGTSPKAAVETARANVFDVSPETVKARREAWSQGKGALAKGSSSALAALIDRDYDSVFSSQPEALDPRAGRAPGALNLEADFARQTEQYFLRTGDVEHARELAWADLQRVYGPTRVNGVTVMSAFPIERWGLTPEDVRAEISAALLGDVKPLEQSVDRARTALTDAEAKLAGLDEAAEAKRLAADSAFVDSLKTKYRQRNVTDRIDAQARENIAAQRRSLEAATATRRLELESAEYALETRQGRETSIENVIVVPDAMTLRNVGDALSGKYVRPSFKLVDGETGDLVTDAHGIPLRFTVPSSEDITKRIETAQAKATAEAAAKVDDARKKRTKIHEMREGMAAQGAFPGY
jgi:hypothetical protein